MASRFRKITLLAHIATSVGWLGAVIPYLALALAGLLSKDIRTANAAYLSMALIGWYVLVPLSLAALLSGLVQSLTTRWGLIRHWWIVAKLVLTIFSIAVLFRHMMLVSRVAQVVTDGTHSAADLHTLRVQLIVHPLGGLLTLLIITALSVFKPWGATPYGQRSMAQAHSQSSQRAQVVAPRLTELATRTPHRNPGIGIHALHAVGVAILIAVIFHLTSGHMMHH